MKKLFSTEKEMQRWITNELAKKRALIEMLTNHEEYTQLEDFQDKPAVYRKIAETFRYCLRSFYINEIISENADISLSKKDKLCPDFLLFAPETQSIVIVELKNISGPSRQVGTEIGAYAAEVKTYLPFLSEGDIVNVVISTEWPTLLRHYAFNEITWLHKNLICLEPVEESHGIGLQILDINRILESNIPLPASEREIGGYHLCLYDAHRQRGRRKNQLSFENYEDQMRASINAMSTKGNMLKAHGFAFLWENQNFKSLAPYVITIVNVAAFQSLTLSSFERQVRSNPVMYRLQQLVTDHMPEGHGQTLEAIREFGERLLTSFCDPQPEMFATWDYLKPQIFNQGLVIAFAGWGIFDEFFFDHLMHEYQELGPDHGFDPNNPMMAIDMLNRLLI